MALIKSFFIHGFIPTILLLSTLMPIIKDKLGSINVSSNYRSVCLTSIIIKILDWIYIEIYGTELGFHNLQFAYQQGISSVSCIWAVIETISYFKNNGSEVFVCSMDKTKAFDLCKFSLLFSKLSKSINPVYTRLLIFCYTNQYSNVFFNENVSENFPLRNGVGQGKVLAGFLYCYYCFELFEKLEKSGYGCKIKGTYAGIYGFSDDDIAVAPTYSSLVGMMSIIEEFCNEHGLTFSTNKKST